MTTRPSSDRLSEVTPIRNRPEKSDMKRETSKNLDEEREKKEENLHRSPKFIFSYKKPPPSPPKPLKSVKEASVMKGHHQPRS